MAGDGEALVVVLPGGKDEELAASTGFHALAAGLGEVGEAVFLQDDERETFGEGGAHDGFLSRRDAGRYQHGSAAGLDEEPRRTLGYLLGGEAARALHL